MASTKSRLIRHLSGTRTLVSGIPSYDTAADILVKDLTVRRLEGDYEAQNYVSGEEGAQGDRFYNGTMGLQFQVDAHLPDAGTPPLYGALLEACGMKELVTAGVSTTYSLRPKDEEQAQIALQYVDSQSSQVTESARGALSFTAEAKKPPMFGFNLMGALFDGQAAIDSTPDFTGWDDAPECTTLNMEAFTVNGVTLCVQSFSFTDGRTPRRNKFMNCDDTDIIARNITGRMVVKTPPAATLDLLALAKSTEKVPLVWEITPPAGRTMRISAPAVQLKYSGEQDIDGELGMSLDLVFTFDQGDDEIAITFS